MAKQFEGKVALVSGASSGIGRATALAFAEAGAKVVLADVNVKGGEESVAMIERAGGEAMFVNTDVSQADQVEALVAETVEAYGRLDFAHNNAGIDGEQAPTAECSEDNWDKTIAVNLKGVWLAMKYELQQMLAQGGGAIVNTSSIAGLVGFRNLPAYVASKHGVVGLTRTAALEYATSGIRVNAVNPGVIRTPMVTELIQDDPETEKTMTAGTPMGRLGQADEIAQTVLWLCSDAASFVTGHAMVADGGFVAQ